MAFESWWKSGEVKGGSSWEWSSKFQQVKKVGFARHVLVAIWASHSEQLQAIEVRSNRALCKSLDSLVDTESIPNRINEKGLLNIVNFWWSSGRAISEYYSPNRSMDCACRASHCHIDRNIRWRKASLVMIRGGESQRSMATRYGGRLGNKFDWMQRLFVTGL